MMENLRLSMCSHGVRGRYLDPSVRSGLLLAKVIEELGRPEALGQEFTGGSAPL